MSEAKHTTGPWRVEVDTGPEAAWERKWPTIHAEKYEVVGCEGLYGDYETDMANARLIAAAPDLLAACEFVLAHAFERKWDEDGRAFTMISSALRKAAGGAA